MSDSKSVFRTDCRGTSITTGYVLNLAIAAVLIGGLIVAAGGVVDSRSDQAAQSQMDVLGNQISAEIAGADRLVAASEDSDNATVRVSVALPDQVGGQSYLVSIDSDTDPKRVTLETNRVRVTVQIPKLSTPVESTTVNGGELEVVYVNGSLEVHSS